MKVRTDLSFDYYPSVDSYRYDKSDITGYGNPDTDGVRYTWVDPKKRYACIAWEIMRYERDWPWGFRIIGYDWERDAWLVYRGSLGILVTLEARLREFFWRFWRYLKRGLVGTIRSWRWS